MKKLHLPLCFLLLLTLCALAKSIQAYYGFLTYQLDRRVPWANGGGYERCEYDWWVRNTGQPSELFLNGVSQGVENGTNDIRLLTAWSLQPTGVPIGVVDVNAPHGQRVKAVAEKVSRTQALLSESLRLYPDDIASAISNFLSLQYKAIVVTSGFNFAHAGLSNACRYAELENALVFCAVPNAQVSIDLVPDYPSSWAAEITSIVPVTATDRNGNLYGPGAAAYGTNVIGAPGRNIICASNYTSGTSIATPIAAGCVSLLMKREPGQSSAYYRNKLWNSTVESQGVWRINAVNLLQ